MREQGRGGERPSDARLTRAERAARSVSSASCDARLAVAHGCRCCRRGRHAPAQQAAWRMPCCLRCCSRQRLRRRCEPVFPRPTCWRLDMPRDGGAHFFVVRRPTIGALRVRLSCKWRSQAPWRCPRWPACQRGEPGVAPARHRLLHQPAAVRRARLAGATCCAAPAPRRPGPRTFRLRRRGCVSQRTAGEGSCRLACRLAAATRRRASPAAPPWPLQAGASCVLAARGAERGLLGHPFSWLSAAKRHSHATKPGLPPGLALRAHTSACERGRAGLQSRPRPSSHARHPRAFWLAC